MSEKKLDCGKCYYGRFGGCSCEDEMAASCIPTPMTKEDYEEQAEHVLAHFKATIKEVEELVATPGFARWFKKHHAATLATETTKREGQ